MELQFKCNVLPTSIKQYYFTSWNAAVDQTQEMQANHANSSQAKEMVPVIMLVFRDK